MKIRTTEKTKQVTVKTKTHALTLNDAELRVLQYALTDFEFEGQGSGKAQTLVDEMVESIGRHPAGVGYFNAARWVVTGDADSGDDD